MKKMFSLLAVLTFSTAALFAQNAVTNDSIVKMTKAGLSDSIIIATIDSSPNAFSTTPDALVALKNAGVSDKVIGEMVKVKTTAPATAQDSNTAQAPLPPPTAPSGPPRVFLTSTNSGSNWGGILHNQTMEMSKDFGRDCPSVVITVNQNSADYVVNLNHVESGLIYRDNQMQVSNHNGDVISEPSGRGESIAAGVKRSCDAIMADWNHAPAPPPAQ